MPYSNHAQNALNALIGYANYDPADLPATISDFLADLQHLSDEAGIDFSGCAARGSRHYAEELASG
jgi:hypothetical protein